MNELTASLTRQPAGWQAAREPSCVGGETHSPPGRHEGADVKTPGRRWELPAQTRRQEEERKRDGRGAGGRAKSRRGRSETTAGPEGIRWDHRGEGSRRRRGEGEGGEGRSEGSRRRRGEGGEVRRRGEKEKEER